MLQKIIHKNLLFLSIFALWLIISSIILFVFSDKEIFFAINNLHSPFFDKVMTVLSSYGRGDSITIVFVLLLIFAVYRSREYLFTTISFGVILPVINRISKDYFDKARPMGEYSPQNVHSVPWLENLFFDSFPSGHTMGAFGFFLLLNYFVPEKKWYVTLLFFLLALGCGYSRIYLGQHFFSDVAAGSFAGVFISLAILFCVNLGLQKKEFNV